VVIIFVDTRVEVRIEADDLLLIALKLANRRAAGSWWRDAAAVSSSGLVQLPEAVGEHTKAKSLCLRRKNVIKGREGKSKENPCAISSGLSNRSCLQSSLLR
jgi:hypothetical protein